MPNVVVILPSTTYRAADFVKAAEELSVNLIVASDTAPPFDMGDRYLAIDCADPEAAAEAIAALGDRAPIDGVVAADDAGVVVAALAGRQLGLPANDPRAAEATRDKEQQRRLMAASEVPQPRFTLLGDQPLEDAASIGYPLVIKPTDRSAGQGVIRVEQPSALEPALALLRSILGQDAVTLAEQFVPGEEVALEGLMANGELMTLALFDKPAPTDGPGFEETILVTPSSLPLDTQAECERVADAALKALGLTHGPIHVEMKVYHGHAQVIEVAARSIGGLCSQSLQFGLMGTSHETLILRNALGMDKRELRRERVASGVLMIPIPSAGSFAGIPNLDEIAEIEGISGIEMTAPLGAPLAPPPEGDRYIGFVFARADTPEEVTRALITARDLVEVQMA